MAASLARCDDKVDSDGQAFYFHFLRVGACCSVYRAFPAIMVLCIPTGCVSLFQCHVSYKGYQQWLRDWRAVFYGIGSKSHKRQRFANDGCATGALCY